MMEILGYVASIFIGISLGMVGSGGSILTVPVLVYLMGVSPLLATTSSLFIVGITSLAGGIRAYTRHLVDFKAVTEFGIPSILSIFVTRHYILPAIPSELFKVGNVIVTKELALMVIFAILMMGSAITMILSHKKENRYTTAVNNHNKVFPLMLLGLGIGVITGLLGAGGGFLIIPALVLFLRLPMKVAVGTSLLIIAINSLFGFLFSLKQYQYDWTVLIIFSLLAVIGIFIGSKIAEHIPASRLKRGFGVFVLVMGIYIVLKELVL
jgi:uncharacterized membrane protein YfcA